jgi:predicted nuclease of predicted toxin-antitoxin system
VKFKIDENLPGELAAELRTLGHDADTVFDEGLAGVLDPDLMAAASSENRILLTLDKGIANLERYPLEQHSGVVLFRPVRSGRRGVLAFIRERLPDLLELDLRHRLTIVGSTRIRVR